MSTLAPLTFAVKLDLDGLPTLNPVAQRMLLRRAALLIAEGAKGQWVHLAGAMRVRHTGAYINGIESNGIVRIVEEKFAGDEWEVTVAVTNTAPHASFVEEGHPAFSMVDAIDWNRTDGAIKRSKDGTRYLHIPFRHSAYVRAATPRELGQPGGPPRGTREGSGQTYASLRRMMPQHIHREAKKLHYVTAQRVGPIRSPEGRFQARDRYNWPKGRRGRLDRSHTTPSIQLGTVGGHAPGMATGHGSHNVGFEEHRGQRMVGRDRNGNPLINPAWGSSKYHGLFKAGSRGHAQYMTIRTISEKSAGWNIPAQHGRFVARRVAEGLGRSTLAQDAIAEALAGGMLG